MLEMLVGMAEAGFTLPYLSNKSSIEIFDKIMIYMEMIW